jgi:Flp pilus assembly protein TadG
MKKLRILKNNKGQSVVEFALIVPILLLLVFGIVEFGYAFTINQ